MARGGFRPTAGRRADPNSARQKRLAAKAAKEAGDRTLTAADGTKKPDAPKDWPFGTTVPPEPQKVFATPIEYWKHVLADPEASDSQKAAAAYAMAPYVHPRIAPAAKKEEAKEKAAKAATGRFTRKVPPRLVVDNR